MRREIKQRNTQTETNGKMEKPPKYRFFSMRRLLSKKKPARAGLAAAPPKASSSAKEFAWFVSHIQRQGGDQAHLLALLAPLLHDGLPGWFDMFVRGDLNADTMKAGVLASRNFVLYLTDGIPNSWFCLLELDTALANNANMVLVLETDEVRGAVADLDQTFGLIASRLNFNCGVSDSPADETTSGFNSFGKPPGFKRWTGAEIRARFSKVIEYDHKHPEESIRQIMHSPAPPLPQFQSSGADVQIVCNRVQGLDQAWVLMLMMAELGIKAAIVQHAREFDPSLPTIFFCTQHLLEDEVVVSALKQVDASSKVALVHEADGRRHGGLNGSEELFWSTMLSGDEGGLLRAKSASSVAFSKSTRNVMFSGAFSSAVLDLLGLLPPPFACRQPSLVLPEFETSVALPRVSDWVLNDQSERGMLLKRNGLLASLPRDRVVAFVDCSLEVDDFGVVKSLAAQLVAGIPGFAQGLHLDTDVQDLDELCDVLLVCPLETAQSLLFFAKQGKLVAVLRGLTSDALARALRLVMDKFPPTFGLVISSEVDNVHRALNDLSDGETEQKAVVAQPTTAAAATKLGETKARWDICIIFVPNEGSNAARSLAIELANNGNQKVWFDANRHELQPHQVALGILYSNLIVVVVTKSLATHPMLLTELRLARTCDKRIVFVKEGDPVYFGDKDLVVEGDHVLELKRMGKPRKELVNMLREEAGFPVLLDAYQPAFGTFCPTPPLYRTND